MSSTSNLPPTKCLRAAPKLCDCGRRTVLKISQQNHSKHCLFYSCPGYIERNGSDCHFFAWCESIDGAHNNDEEASSTLQVDVQRNGTYNHILPTCLELRIIVKVTLLLTIIYWVVNMI